MCKLDKTETLGTTGDMTYVWEVTKLTCIVVYVYISSLPAPAIENPLWDFKITEMPI